MFRNRRAAFQVKSRQGNGLAKRVVMHKCTSLHVESLEDRTVPAAVPSLLKDINANGLFSNPTEFTAVGNVCYFAASNDANGNELWLSDGTTAGTLLVKDIYPGASSSSPRNMTAVGNQVFFVAGDGSNGRELWKSDGTAAGTVMVANLTPGSSGSTSIRSLFASQGKLYFSFAAGSGIGRELCVSDGTPAGTGLVKDINPGSGDAIANLAEMIDFNGALYFAATDGTSGVELWKTDGTTVGTVRVLDLVSGAGSSTPSNLTVVDSRLFFSSGADVFCTDGSIGNVVQLTTAPPGTTAIGSMVNAAGTLFFTRIEQGTSGGQIWRSTGALAGTELVRQLPLSNAGLTTMNPGPLTAFGSRVVFSNHDLSNGDEPWISDGTTAGTHIVADISPGVASSIVGSSGILTLSGAITAIDAAPPSLMPDAYTNSTSTVFAERFSSLLTTTITMDRVAVGTVNSTSDLGAVEVPAGTLVDSYYVHLDPPGATTLVVANGSITFDREILGVICQNATLDASDSALGVPSTLYPNGLGFRSLDLDADTDWFDLSNDRRTITFHLETEPQADDFRIVTRAASTCAIHDGIAYFAATDGQTGVELWRTDGTGLGTTQCLDINAGTGSGLLGDLKAAGSSLYFRGFQDSSGAEPWVVAATPPTITGVFFDGSTWSSAFRTAAGNASYGYSAQVGVNQLKSMPWSTINTVYVKFSENVTVDSADLGVRGLNLANYGILNFTYDSVNFVAKWTLSGPIDTDRLILDLDGDSGTAITDTAGNKLAGSWTEGVSTFPTTGIAGNDFKFRFVVAVGDADRNGLVRNADVNLVRANLFVDAGQAGYNIYADIDGNGLTRNADVNTVRSHLFVDPPAGPGPNRPIHGGRPGSRDHSAEPFGNRFTEARSSGQHHAGTTLWRMPAKATVDVLDWLFEEL